MAGIGFELKKIFKERSIFNLLKGALYSAFTIIGPMLIVIICYVLIFAATESQHAELAQKDLLTSIVLYVFVFSLIFTSPLSAVVSRFIADKIFEEKNDDILACYFAGLFVNVIMGAAGGVPFLIVTSRGSGTDPLILLLAGCMYAALIFVFYNMTFISALKEYKSIVIAFITGMGIALALSWALSRFTQTSFIMSVLIGMTVGFLIIAFTLFALVRKFFTANSGNYREFFTYLWRYKLLFLANLFYILGMYIHNFVYWHIPSVSIVIETSFRSAPVYDTASFLAMMTNVSTMVIFTVHVEINFHDRYQEYCQQLIGGTGRDIVLAKNNMFITLVKEILYIVQTQAAISIIVYLILNTFASYLGLGGLVIAIYPTLAAGFFVVYIMYAMIVFLYYFNDGTGAFVTSLVFFAVAFAVSLIAVDLSPNLYGIGLFAGAFAGWVVSFFRLKHIEKNIDRLMFCRGDIVKRRYVKPSAGRKAGSGS